MADTAIAITAGSGTNVDTRTEGTNGNHRQVVVLGDPATNAGVAPVDATAGLKVDLGADNDVTVSGVSTAAKQDTIIGHLDGVEGVLGTIDADTGNISTKIDTVAGAVSGTEMQVDVLTSALPSGAATSAKQDTAQTALDAIKTATETIDNAISGSEMQVDVVGALPAGNNNIGDVDVASLPALAAGTNAIGKLVANSGVDIGDVDVTSISAGTNLIADVSLQPRSDANGLSVGNYTTGDTYTALTNSAQAIKASAGKFYGYYIYNPNSSATYVMVYDIAHGSVTVGTSTAKLVFCIPATSGANLEISMGIPFASAMSIAAATTGGGNSAPATALEAMVWYK